MPLLKPKAAIEAGTEFLEQANNIIEGTVTNQKQRGTLKNQFSQLWMVLQQQINEQVTRRLESDNQGSILTRNIRPLVLLILVLGYMFSDFIGLSEAKTAVMAEWGNAAILFYFGARTLEKAIPMITDFTKSLRRKG